MYDRSYTPKALTVVPHSSRDISFIIPQALPEVGFLPSAHQKRLSTALKWSGIQSDKVVELDNAPVQGFVLETLNGRYHTEVEYLCVRHPKGYVFEIPFQNLLDIIKEVGVGVGGVIQGDCYMVAVSSKWAVVPVGGSMDSEAQESHKRIVDALVAKKSNATKKFGVGAILKFRDDSGKHDWLYIGKLQPRVSYNGDFCLWERVRDSRQHNYGDALAICHTVAPVVTAPNGMSVLRESVGSGDFFVSWRQATVKKQKLMTFVRLNKDGTPSQTVALFKSKSVQFQPTDRTDIDLAKLLAVKGLDKTYTSIDYLSSIRTWNMFDDSSYVGRYSGDVGMFSRDRSWCGGYGQVSYSSNAGGLTEVGDMVHNTSDYGRFLAHHLPQMHPRPEMEFWFDSGLDAEVDEW